MWLDSSRQALARGTAFRAAIAKFHNFSPRDPVALHLTTRNSELGACANPQVGLPTPRFSRVISIGCRVPEIWGSPAAHPDAILSILAWSGGIDERCGAGERESQVPSPPTDKVADGTGIEAFVTLDEIVGRPSAP